MKNKIKVIFKRIVSITVAFTILNLSVFHIIKNNEKDEKKEKSDTNDTKWFITYEDPDNPNLFSSEAEILKSYMDNNTIDDEEVIVDENNTPTYNFNFQSPSIKIEEEPKTDRENVIEDLNIDISVIENKSKQAGEELILNSDINDIRNVLYLLYDKDNDGIPNDYKLYYIKNLYTLSDEDLYILYSIFSESIDLYPTINPFTNIKDILSIVFDRKTYLNYKEQFIINHNLNSYDLENGTNEMINKYLNNNAGTIFNTVIDSLYYKQINNIPLDWALNYIYNRYDINKEQLTTIMKCVLTEAEKDSYLDAYGVTNVLYNRTCSKLCTQYYGENIYDQLKADGQFDVLYNGSYQRTFGNKTLEEIINERSNAMAVIDCLIEEGLMHKATSYYSVDYVNENSAQFSENGNNYFNYTDEFLSLEDTIPVNERHAKLFKNIGIYDSYVPYIMNNYNYDTFYKNNNYENSVTDDYVLRR